MAFDPADGSLILADGLLLHRGLRRADLAHGGHAWEEWLHYGGEPVRYHCLGRDTRSREAWVLVVLFWPGDGPLRGWDLAPRQAMHGAQSRPEGRHTRALREWFRQRHGADLPCRGAWGDIDAAHDPHNLTTSVVCSYASSEPPR